MNLDFRNTKTLYFSCLLLLTVILFFSGCRHDDIVYLPEEVGVGQKQLTEIKGFYLLNEGNMGSNKCTLDFYDYETATYTRNYYAEINPDVPMELGDVGNDLESYGSRLYAVINCSNKVEVMRLSDARRIGQIEIPNCRSIAFDGQYAYVTSYAGPVEISQDYSQLGYVAKVDTATLQVVDRCIVGYQPDGIAVCDGKLYVCNSGGYRVPNYENTVSVIDLETFKETGKIPVAINLSKIIADKHNRLWISSRGDYYNVDPGLYLYDTKSSALVGTFPLPVGSMDLCGDSLYVVASRFSYETMSSRVTNAVINTETLAIEPRGFITDGTETDIKVPYCVRVNPLTKEILVTDARNYVNPGRLHCYSPEGRLLWSVRTGDIPAHILFRSSAKNVAVTH